MQAHQAGNPAGDMLALQPQRLSGPIQRTRRLMGQHPLGHRRHIQQMRQHTMTEAIVTLGPKTTGLLAEIGESFHLALLASHRYWPNKVPASFWTDNSAGGDQCAAVNMPDCLTCRSELCS
jgi:hypothetical protein